MRAACLKLLFDPRAVRFGTPHYEMLLHHCAQLGWVKQWRQCKAVVFRSEWATNLALPRPIYDPGCKSLYEGLIPKSRSMRAASVAANVRPNRSKWPVRELGGGGGAGGAAAGGAAGSAAAASCCSTCAI